MSLSPEQIKRYKRQTVLKEIGPKGQEKISASKVLIIGVGGIGSPAAMYLAAAGVGTIGLADGDKIDISNLQRQIIHSTDDIGRLKTASAKERIAAINPQVNVQTHDVWVDASNIGEIIIAYDFIIDATDNFVAKFLINDACVCAQKPFSHGGVMAFQAQTLTCVPGTTCYRCIFSDPPPLGLMPTCAEMGVLGSVVGILGAIQATEALKYLADIKDLLINCLLIFDAKTMHFRKVYFNRNPRCAACGK
ncbi:MAG: HesA/MoeB/ThiF family protein [Candidatus Omnitrophica bacterium]|nr:HesA/MoeB/ThiF family protein [Candidatus Omnitrophota bacterium]